MIRKFRLAEIGGKRTFRLIGTAVRFAPNLVVPRPHLLPEIGHSFPGGFGRHAAIADRQGGAPYTTLFGKVDSRGWRSPQGESILLHWGEPLSEITDAY